MALVHTNASAQAIPLNDATVVLHSQDPVVQTAGRVLVEEIAKRTGIELKQASESSEERTEEIHLCIAGKLIGNLRSAAATVPNPQEPESYAITVQTRGAHTNVLLIGHDGPGVLYAVGRLLLTLDLREGALAVPANFKADSAPRYPHRGHQIAHRSLAHCYDAWTEETYEQYMRELAIFGANAFENTSYTDPAQLDGPLAKVTRGDMSAAWSRICEDYGFDYWMFGSAYGGEGASLEEEMERKEALLEMLESIPHLDHLYLTGGDGNSRHRRPDLMFEALEDFAEEARKIHPELGIWTSNQGADPEQNNWFFDYLQHEQPTWLTGIIHGAWNRILASEQRARTPKQYPIRRYPDIGHAVRAQYTVPEWDRAYARTLGREPFAPRPKGQANIHNLFDEYCDGFVTYSDGIGDDLNKFVWTALGWDPDRPLDDIVLDYSRFFFGPDIAEEVRAGIFQFEKNFDEPLHSCKGVEENYKRWKTLEENADEELLANWRFQSSVMRATFDYYQQQRLRKAMDTEERALAVLRKAPSLGVEKAIDEARAILDESDQDAEAVALREHLEKLGAELFESIGAQLDVERYHARREERGAILDFLDIPLNNREWLEDEFDAILSGRFTASTPEGEVEGDIRLARLDNVANWENPGPGSLYDDLGYKWKSPHQVKHKTQWEDPGSIESPREGHTMSLGGPDRLSWLDLGEALCGTPIEMRYENLDPNARYRVKVTYLGRYNATIRLTADDQYQIHGSYGHTLEGVRYTIGRDGAAVVTKPAANEDEDAVIAQPPVTPLEFVIPIEATKDGVLNLRWDRDTGRGIQIAEVWLLKQ